jgi:hypothetical protein
MVCTGIAITFIAVGLLTASAFFRAEWKNTPEKLPPVEETVGSGAR